MKTLFEGFNPKSYPEGSMTQGFGENYLLYKEHFDMDGHNGIDYVAPWGTPLFPLKEGIVVEHKNTESGYGKYIRILTEEVDGVCEEWVYGHLADIYVELGQEVTKETCIGTMGNTGFVVSGATPFWKYNPYAGTHLHLGVRKVKMFKSGDKTWNITYATGHRGTIVNYDNGFKGSVDFKHEFSETPNEEVRQKQLTVISLANQVIELYKKLISFYKK